MIGKKGKRNAMWIGIICLVILGVASGYYGGRNYHQQKIEAENKAKVEAQEKQQQEKAKEDKVEKKDAVKDKSKEDTDAWANMSLKHNDKGVPVLMYHSIAYEKNNEVRLPKEKFQEQMKYLKENGYVTLTLDQVYNFFVNDKPVPEKSLVLTFDDGYEDNYKDAFPILKEYGFKATVFVITAYVDKSPEYMTSAQLKEMQAAGIDIESHTVNHEYLNKIPYGEQVKTLKESKEFLEKLLNKQIHYLAYPYGKYTNETLKAVKELGYTMAVTTDGKWSYKKNGILTLDRVYISGLATLDIFKERITNPDYKTQ